MANQQKRKLPPYCLEDKYGVRFKPYLGRVNGKIKWGKTITIAPPNTPMSEVWKAYEEAVGDERQTLGWLLALYKDSDRFRELSPKSQQDYAKAIEKLTGAPVGNDRFGSVELRLIDKRSIRSYLDTYPSPIAANRQIAVLKSAWNWVLERYNVPENPCIGVKLNREAPRQRYVTDDEYETALGMAPPPIQQYMELAYLLRARWSEVRNLTTSDVTDEYVVLERLKGSEGEHTMLSERLRGVLSDVRADPYICHQYTQSGFSSAWRRLMAKVDKPFTYHDLKSKGVSDHKDNHSGHRSAAMRKTYVRKKQEVPATR